MSDSRPDAAPGDEHVRAAVREFYAQAAVAADSCSCSPITAGTGFGSTHYADDDAEALPAAAVIASLGCGNPTALATLEPGEVVLDLGSGGGIDVLLSARRVGPAGRAFGLDMTPEMHELALRNRAEAGVDNAEFLLGTIEDIPLPDATVDVVISNCVINLAADKDQVLREAHRVLRPGGRFAVSDVVLRRPLPPRLDELVGLWTGCVAGALTEDEYRTKLAAAGFVDIEVQTTHVHDRAGVEQLAALVDVPDDLDVEATIDEVAGVVTNAFVRARRADT
ncbi:MAG TPA: arsenite methyltransferase [Acidimicrobiales bacterium]|nr:arsenite methyltransferase [Acidimicrobiales bacterium]